MRSEYDNPVFFEEYAKMARSRDGLPAAGEWHQLKPLFPPLAGKQVLDLGCGYGWHCKYVAEHGRAPRAGHRPQPADAGRRRSSRNVDPRITYRLCSIEAYEYPAEYLGHRWYPASPCTTSRTSDPVFGRNVYRTLKTGRDLPLQH